MNLTNEKQELLAISFQNGNEEALTELIENYRGRIQSRAYNASVTYGLDEAECESVLINAVWTAVKKWEKSSCTPFVKFVSMQFKYALDHLFTGEERRLSNSCEKVYDFYSTEFMNLTDPREDVEAMVESEDGIKRLTEFLEKDNKEALTVALLKTAGYEYKNIAKMLKYNPEGVKDKEKAQIAWAFRKVKELQKPTLKYYFEFLGLKEMPINLSI